MTTATSATAQRASLAGRPIHIGLMVPSNNTTMEGELLGWLPPGSSCHTLKIPRGQGLLTDETIPAYKQAAIDLCQQFSSVPIDVIAYGCTAAGFILGPEGDHEIAQRLAAVSGKPVVTTASSMMIALNDAKASKLSLLTPYQDDVNHRLISFLASGHLTVSHFASFYAADVVSLAKITEEEVAERARLLCKDDVDALFIACSQLPTLNVVEHLSRMWGKPVLSSIQVTAHCAQRLVEAA